MRLIDADELKIDYGFTWDDITPTHEEMYALIDRQPTIEERETGSWIREDKRYKDSEQEYYYYEEHCSVCGARRKIGWTEANYCPNCGCFMKEGNDER